MSRAKHLTKSLALYSCVIVVAVVMAGAWNALRPLPSFTGSAQTISIPKTTASDLAWPDEAEAAVGGVGYGVLVTYGDEKPLPTASVAKVITALAVLQKQPLSVGEQGPNFTVGQSDVALYNDYVSRDGSVVAVTQGEQLSEYQALQAMLLPSANNVADSMATWVFGSQAAYASYATAMVQQLGLAHTTIGSDASGFSPSTVSTPDDLVLLGIAALKNPVIAQIVAQRSAVLPVAGTVYNVNALLGSNGVVGIKTGNSDEAGGCLLFASTKSFDSSHSATTVGAVMGVTDLTAALHTGLALSNSAQANFQLTHLVHAGQVLGTFHAPWGGTVNALATKDITLTTWNGSSTDAHVHLNFVNKALPRGANVGTATVTFGSLKASTPIVLQDGISKPSVWWRVTRH